MCLIAIAIDSHPAFPLIIAANRDEFYNRPTRPLEFWKENPDILAGRDLQGGGTWLGITRKGKIGTVTNFREPASLVSRGEESRGRLVKDYLEGDMPPAEYLSEVEKNKTSYSGFNLVLGDTGQLWWYSNKNGGIVKLTAGIHAVSNHLLNTPWPKVKAIKRKMQKLISNSRIDPYKVLDLLFDTTPAPDSELPDTGVNLQWERMLSPVFVASPDYGTRSSSVILVESSGRLIFCERTFSHPDGEPLPEDTRCFQIQPS